MEVIPVLQVRDDKSTRIAAGRWRQNCLIRIMNENLGNNEEEEVSVRKYMARCSM